MIYTNDHAPAHVHAKRKGGEAKIDLGRIPKLIRVNGIGKATAKTLVDEVTAQRTLLRKEWKRIHG
jgi:hypothetical protein